MNNPSEAQSPLNAIANAHQPALSIREKPLQGYLNLRGQPGQTAFIEAVRSVTGIDVPVTPNTLASREASRLLWLAPSEWLLITPPDTQDDLAASLRQAFGTLFAAVTDVSSGYTAIEIKGFAARELLARGCSLDLHPRAFGPDRCAQTLLAKAGVIIVQVDESPTFHVIVRRSLAAYLWSWLNDATHDLNGRDSA